MALEIISVHKIEVSEGVSIFYKEKKNQYTSPYRIKDGQISFKVSFVRVGPMGHPMSLKFCIQVDIVINFNMGKPF